ncbi:hypothetical protein BC628DRAFT_1319774 [Trametes gibbosa]|nr:hypothetical protein BC628DRAFT_1319774 [Trametes gibbosa]
MPPLVQYAGVRTQLPPFSSIQRYSTLHATVSRRCLRHLSTGSRHSSIDYARDAKFPVLNTRPVPDAPPALAGSPQAFLEYICSPAATPFVLRGRTTTSTAHPKKCGEGGGRAETLLRTLRAAKDRLVEVEVGRYDKVGGGGRMEVPLGVYLDWLSGDQDAGGSGEEGNADGRMQLYLAQWRARDEIPGLEDEVKAPSLLAPLLESQAVDLYQTSFFVGPSDTVTPLHYDPYYNLYNVHASSDPVIHAKHFVLLPPALSAHLARSDGSVLSVLRNTSPIELHLRRDASQDSFAIAIDPSTAPLRATEALARTDAGAMSCVLRERDTLFVPRRWWHRVEAVRLRDAGAAAATADAMQTSAVGWTAGVGWWFLPRTF